MAVHVPLSLEAQIEARVLMMSTNNILSPANGEPIIVPSQDIVLGLYYLTRERPLAKGERIRFDGNKMRPFSSPDEVRIAYDQGTVELHAQILVRMDGSIIPLNEILGDDNQINIDPAARLQVIADGNTFETTAERLAVSLAEKGIDPLSQVQVRQIGKIVTTTVGRILLSEIMPADISFDRINRTMTKKEIRKLIGESYRKCGIKTTVVLADRLKDMGYKFATQAGISIAIDDMVIPHRKAEILSQSQAEVAEVESQYREGLITEGEKYNKVVDIWARATDEVASEMMEELAREKISGSRLDENGNPVPTEVITDSFNPIFMMADSGARGSDKQMRQLAGMRGLMAKPSGEIIATPITANFREGLTVLQYFISTHGARKGLADTALKTANSGYLTRRLVDVAQDCVITEVDCGTIDGIDVTPLIEGGEIIQRVGERVLGRTTLEDIIDPNTDETIVSANEEIDEDAAQKIEEAGLEKLRIRSVLTCQTRHGVCAKCYGRDLAHGTPVNIGEAIGIMAAQSIGEPGTQLTMRTFHIGGTASRRAEQSVHVARNRGKAQFENVRTVRDFTGHLVALSRQGELVIVSAKGKERYPITYGTRLRVEEGQEVQPDQVLAEWDPYTNPILTEVSGVVKFGDIIEQKDAEDLKDVTMQERVDPVTSKSSKVVIECQNSEKRPRISIKDESGRTARLPNSQAVARYPLPVGAILMVNEGDLVNPGDVIAKIPRETTKTKDIVGGLPRVAELFEVRKPKEHAVISQISGTVSHGRQSKGKRKVVVTPEVGDPIEYLIPKGKHIAVQEGERVKAGEPLMDGSANPHDILAVSGLKELARYLVNEVQEVYRLQGVKINDKHIEVIVRQMLRRVRVTDPGDTNFLIGEQIEKYVFEEKNDEILAQGKRPATAEPLLLGITKASLSTESWISAASFQETTKVLADAAVAGRIDYLRGLKENVIMGRPIPAGTGLAKYRNIKLQVLEEPAGEAAGE
jgi:DNA-directed RNA polymerase subunit beta'